MKRLLPALAVLLLTLILSLILSACSTLDEIRVENTCDRPVNIDVVEVPEGFTAEDGFTQSAVVQAGTTEVVAGLVNFGGQDRGVLKVLETGWSIDFDKTVFDEQDGLVMLPPGACPA